MSSKHPLFDIPSYYHYPAHQPNYHIPIPTTSDTSSPRLHHLFTRILLFLISSCLLYLYSLSSFYFCCHAPFHIPPVLSSFLLYCIFPLPMLPVSLPFRSLCVPLLALSFDFVSIPSPLHLLTCPYSYLLTILLLLPSILLLCSASHLPLSYYPCYALLSCGLLRLLYLCRAR